MQRVPSIASGSYSLRRRLLVLLLVAVAVTVLIQGVVAYQAAGREADEVFDYHMRQIALALRGQQPIASAHPTTEEPDFDFVIQVWRADGTPMLTADARETLPRQAGEGFSEVIAHGEHYRVFAMRTPTQIIQVGQHLAARNELAVSLALGTAAPVLLLAPLLMLAVWGVVTQAIRPLDRARQQIACRAADELRPLAAPGLPDEVRPLVDELNLLFARLAESFDAQRSFVADAAHELRSPLAALRLQVQGLQRAGDAQTQGLAVRRLLAGIDRMTRLVDQMLILAREDATASSAEKAPVDVRAIATSAIGDVLPVAHERAIDVGIVQADPLMLAAGGNALRILLRNLLDNAVKYAVEGGRVDVAIRRDGGAVVVEVADTGPGIPAHERDRAFDRFYRVRGSSAEGSGLGLAIARRIALRHQATITLGASEALGGLLVTVRFPAATP